MQLIDIATNIIRLTVIGEKITANGMGINITYKASLKLNLLLSKISKKNKTIIDAIALLVKPSAMLSIK